ncbi:MAG: MerR family transcriptional regulator, partial [Bacillota bacterium]
MFKIGEFSKINRITIKTLRYYEKIGLLIPDKTDRESGYRYYSISQLNDIINILTLKRMGFSLAEIKNMNISDMDKQTIDNKIAQIKKQLQDCNKMICDLKRLRTQISGGKKMNEVKIKSLPEVIVASHRTI